MDKLLLMAQSLLPGTSRFLSESKAAAKPLAVTYIDTLTDWWPPAATLKDLGVPGYNDCMDGSSYNIVNLAFWLPGTADGKTKPGPTDIATIWADPVKYLGTQSGLGTTKDEILKAIMKKYHDAGIKVMISGFGATAPDNGPDWPEATETCEALAQFALDNYLDGVDLDYECNSCMERGTGEQWLIDCTKAIRKKMPADQGYLVSHAPQAPYFMDNTTKYPNGAYLTVNKEVGDMIDFYNIQFYNQGDTKYETCDELFTTSGGYFPGTAVHEIEKAGVDISKIVIGKPATPADATNTGYMHPDTFEKCIAEDQFKTGFMTWQFPSDIDCKFATEVMKGF